MPDRPLIGVVCVTSRRFFISLASVTPHAKQLGRRILIASAAAAGVAVVILSWRVPEPEVPKNRPQVENMSYLKYTPQQAPPPNYGAR